MVSNAITVGLSVLALTLYGAYVLFSQGIFGLLISIAIALITAAFVDRIEYVTIGILVVGLTYIMAVKRYNCRFEGFGSDQNDEGEILALTNSLTKRIPLKKRPRTTVKGTLSTLHGMEGFADAPSAPQEGEDEDEEADATTTSAPASATETPATQTDQDAAAVATTMATPSQPTNPSQAVPVVSPGTTNAAVNVDTAMTAPAVTTQGFSDEENSGLFKLGQLPSESKAGPFVDVAATMSKAMGALKPDQMAAMTAESKNLLETQQNLMGMLESMRPVLQDGRQLLDTFGSIFGGMGNMGMGSLKI